jgi:hypothetical protein
MQEGQTNPISEVANFVRCENIEETVRKLLKSKNAAIAVNANLYPIGKT